MPSSINKHETILRRIRASLHFAAALALKHDINLASEVSKILDDPQPKLVAKKFIEPKIKLNTTIKSLSQREKMVYETICQESEPVSINELFDKFKVNKEARCSKSTLTIVINVLKKLNLIYYTVIENNKSGYLKKENSSCFR